MGQYQIANQNLVGINNQQNEKIKALVKNYEFSQSLILELREENRKSEKAHAQKIAEFKKAISEDRCAVTAVPASVGQLLNNRAATGSN